MAGESQFERLFDYTFGYDGFGQGDVANNLTRQAKNLDFYAPEQRFPFLTTISVIDTNWPWSKSYSFRNVDLYSGVKESVHPKLSSMNGIARHEPMLTMHTAGPRTLSFAINLTDDVQDATGGDESSAVKQARWLRLLRYPYESLDSGDHFPPPRVRVHIAGAVSISRAVVVSSSVTWGGPWANRGLMPTSARVELTFASIESSQ